MDKLNLWGKRCDDIYIKFNDIYDNKTDINTIKLNEELFGDKLKYKFLFTLKQFENTYNICFNKLENYYNNMEELVNDDTKYDIIIYKRKVKLQKMQNKIFKEIRFLSIYEMLVSSFVNNNPDNFKKYFYYLKKDLSNITYIKRYQPEIKHINEMSLILNP